MDYNKRDCVYRFVKKLFALPFLLEEQIPVTFDALKRTVTSDRVRELTSYIEKTIWTPSTWGVYRMAVRTNNVMTSRDGTTASTEEPRSPAHHSTWFYYTRRPPASHPAKDDQRRKTPEIPTKDYKTISVPHQQTLGQLQWWNYQRGPTSKGMWADLQQTVIKKNLLKEDVWDISLMIVLQRTFISSNFIQGFI